MAESYQVVSTDDRSALTDFLAKQGQLLLPMLDLIEQSRMSVDQLIDVAGRSTLEALLRLSAQQVAGAKHPGRAAGEIRWHGSQGGQVALSDRKVRVNKPRLRRRGGGKDAEVEVPAYEALQADSRLGQRMLEILMHGVSTRSYKKVLPEMAQTVGISKSAVSREFTEASAEAMKELMERRLDQYDILVIYLDGLIFGEHHVLSAVGVDSQGNKHMLGVVEGASENAASAKALLEGMVERGVKNDRARLFVIDGSKALRAAIDAVYGQDNPVQRCRAHKIRNVTDQLPKELRDQVKAAMRASYRLDPKTGMGHLERQAQWLEHEHPTAAASLREGLIETFTVNRIGLPGELRRCLCTTNIIESPHSGIRMRSRRVCRWRDGTMVLRWAATTMLATEANFRKLMGYRHLWMLQSYLKSLREDVLAQTKHAG